MSDKPAHIIRKPEWLRTNLSGNGTSAYVHSLIQTRGLHTICQEGKCPNKAECWRCGTATFMILGDRCTRACKFCATATGHPLPPDPSEPGQLAASVQDMHLKHVVITSVTRDDLPDEGAEHWRQCVEAVRQACPDTTIEVLTPDFNQKEPLIRVVAQARPDLFAHNLETVERLTPIIRSRATYRGSLQTLRIMHELGFRTKTGLMLGLGETEQEVLQTMDDALQAGVSILTMGQYLQPSAKHFPVAAYITPEKFAEYRQTALDKGFAFVESAPLVRSSYHAERAMLCTKQTT